MKKNKKIFILEQERLVSFCNQYSTIYLYGAGLVGSLYLAALRRMGVEPAGFLVSGGTECQRNGIPIFSLENRMPHMSNRVGIIAAFKGATEQLIRENVGHIPAVFVTSYSLAYFLAYDFFLFSNLRTKYRSLPMKDKMKWKNILVIRLDVIGDLVLTTAFLRELRRNCPKSHISMVLRSSNASLFRECPYIDEVLLYDCIENDGIGFLQRAIEGEDKLHAIWNHATSFANDHLCGKRHYDIAFQPCLLLDGKGTLESLFLSLASGADCNVGRLKQFGGSAEFLEFLAAEWRTLMSYVSCDTEAKHEVSCMLDMLQRCGGKVLQQGTELWIGEDDRNFIRRSFPKIFQEETLWIAVGVVGSAPHRNWPPEKYCRFLQEVDDRSGLKVGGILFGGPDATENAGQVMRGLLRSAMVLDLTGKTTLSQAAAAIEQCTLYVGADTGLMHMAAALGKPVVELSIELPDSTGQDGGSPSRMGPWGVDSVVLRPPHALDDCSGCCYKPYPHCITQISVDEVVKAASHFLHK